MRSTIRSDFSPNRSVKSFKAKNERFLGNKNKFRLKYVNFDKQSRKNIHSTLNNYHENDVNLIKKYVKERLKTQNLTSLQQPNVQKKYFKYDDKLSSRSFKETKSQKIFQNQTIQQKINSPNLTLQNIQSQIDNLIDKKFSLLVNKPNYKEESNFKQQLKRLLQKTKQFQFKNPQDQLPSIDQKIRILQKLIASSTAESEIMKKYYQGRISQPQHKQQKRIHTEVSYTGTFNRERQTFFKARSVMRHSVHQKDYRKPSLSDYEQKAAITKRFDSGSGQQPLPRSSYSREFLQYGFVPVVPFKPSDSIILMSRRQKIKTSYQNSFQKKNVQLINYKELDCVKNKFKNLSIRYDTIVVKKPCTQLKIHDKKIKKLKQPLVVQQNKQIQSKQKKQKTKQLQKTIESETKRQYVHNQSILSRSRIKNQYLNSLRFQYQYQNKKQTIIN